MAGSLLDSAGSAAEQQSWQRFSQWLTKRYFIRLPHSDIQIWFELFNQHTNFLPNITPSFNLPYMYISIRNSLPGKCPQVQ